MVWTMALGVLAGCGRGGSQRATELSFEQLADTTGITRGAPVLTAFEPYRMTNGAMRVRGTVEFPDRTRMEISIYRKRTAELVGRVQFVIQNRRFDSPPVLGRGGQLPADDYRFELLTHFNSAWQPPSVMSATGNGTRLHGPGIRRDRLGQAAFLLTREARL